jgi:N,N'-diacetyllegionaminate synthase
MSVFIIAEAGVNHNGSIKIAKKLINLASEAGADAIKFQTFKAENIAIQNSKKANYQKNTTSKKESQYKMLKKLELSKETHQELIRYSKKKKIQFLSSPFDHDSIQLLNDLDLKIFKIPSGEITNFPYLKHVGKLKKKIILSTGMANISEIRKALNILINSGTKKSNIIVLHSNTEYPTPMRDVNLNAMITIRNLFKVVVGYSDHTLGVEVDIAAVALGAKCIEKHFTLDRNMRGPDHKASLEPKELKYMIRSIRNVELALGDGTKKPTKSEKKNIKIVRKSIVAKTKIKKGERFSKKNIAIKRPGTGMSPMKWEKILGTKAIKNYNIDDLI